MTGTFGLESCGNPDRGLRNHHLPVLLGKSRGAVTVVIQTGLNFTEPTDE